MISTNSLILKSKWFLGQHKVRYLWHDYYFNIIPQNKDSSVNIRKPSIKRYNILRTQPIINH